MTAAWQGVVDLPRSVVSVDDWCSLSQMESFVVYEAEGHLCEAALVECMTMEM